MPNLSFRMSVSADSVLPSATMTIGFADSDDLPASGLVVSALNVTTALISLVFTFAVTLTCVATVLVILNKILPFSSVISDCDGGCALLSAVKRTATNGTILPEASVTVTSTAFFASPFAGMPSAVTVISAIFAVALSAVNVTLTNAVLPFTCAVTFVLPDLVFVRSKMVSPLLSVVS